MQRDKVWNWLTYHNWWSEIIRLTHPVNRWLWFIWENIHKNSIQDGCCTMFLNLTNTWNVSEKGLQWIWPCSPESSSSGEIRASDIRTWRVVSLVLAWSLDFFCAFRSSNSLSSLILRPLKRQHMFCQQEFFFLLYWIDYFLWSITA